MDRLPTSTQILQVWGFYAHLPQLEPQRQQDIFDRGYLVGVACNWLAMGKEPPWKKPHPELETRLKGYRQFMRDHDWRLLSYEDEFTDPELKYIAHDDQLGMLDGHLCILELKTGGYNAYATELQTAAQWLAARFTHKDELLRYCLHLPDSGRYKLRPHTNDQNLNDWITLMCSTNLAMQKGLPLGKALIQIMAEDKRYNS